jgi:hypothetical protein
LLASIQERDILDPLKVVNDATVEGHVLLDGFKRYRCAKKLGLTMVPIETLGSDITIGILTLLRREEAGGIDTVEQATLIEELNKHYGMSIYDIAQHLGRSPSWVSMRLGVIEDLSPLVREKIMSGAFPARAYLYGIKGFTRVNKIGRQQVDAFVGAVSGKGLSTRELFVLSRAYFSAGGAIRSLICEGNVRRALRLLLEEAQGVDDATLPQREREFIKDLSQASTGINRVIANSAGIGDGTMAFRHHVNLWCTAIVRRHNEFITIIKDFYDRSGPAGRGTGVLSGGREPQGDSAPVAR